MKKDLSKAYIALGLVSFFWGTTYIASRISALHIPGLFVSALRQFISGALMVIYFKSKGFAWPNKKSLGIISIQSFLLLCIGNGLLTWSLEFISSGLASIIAGLVPVFVALFSILLLKFAKFTWLMIAGLIVGLGGIATIFYEHIHQLLDSKFTFGLALSITATISWSLGSVYASGNKTTVNILFSVGLQMLFAGVCLLIACFLSGKTINLITADHGALWGLLYLIFFGSLLAYSAYVYAISKLPATQVSVYAYINPVVAISLGWLMLHEKMSLNVIVGTLITLAGVYMVNKEFKKQLA